MLNQRCLNIINSKKFQVEALNQLQRWNVDGAHAKMSLTYWPSSTNEYEILCREALAQLLNGRSTTRLATLTFKEFESFLRDDNITPAFQPDLKQLIEQQFENERWNLMYEVFMYFFQKTESVTSLDYIKKIRAANLITHLFGELFGNDFSLKLCHFEHEYLYYEGKNAKLSEESKQLIERIFKFVFNQDIKLVAV